MGTLTLSQLATEFQAGLGNRTDFALAAARTVPILNIAQTRLARAYDWIELGANITNLACSFTNNPAVDKFLPIPKTIKTIHVLTMLDAATPTTQTRKLRGKSVNLFDRLWPAPEALPVYQPVFYTRWGYQLTFYPVPNFAYPLFLRATNFPTAFTSGSPNATSDFDQKDDVLIQLALEYAWRSVGRHDKADQYKQMAMVAIKESIEFQQTMMTDISASDTDIDDSDIIGQYWLNPFVRSVSDIYG